MAFTTGELIRIRAELGFNVLTSGAAPFVNVTAYFETIVQNYITAGAATTSSTAVDASDEPVLVNLTLTDATGFASGDRVWVGVGDSQESSIVQNKSGDVIAVKLTKAQGGAYPVSVDGGEQVVRDLLEKIRLTKAEMADTFGEGSLKKIDEIEWYAAGVTMFANLGSQLSFWRNELAVVLGAPNMWERLQMAGSAISVY